MIMRPFVFLIFLVVDSVISVGQTVKTEATIILNDNSIKVGSLKYGDWESTPDKIQFKTFEEAKFTTYGPDDIKSFLVNDIKYISRTLLIDNTPISTNELKRELLFDTVRKNIFIKQLVVGKSILYEYVSPLGIPNFYIEYKKDSTALLIFKKYIDDNSQIATLEKYKNQLSYYFSDCMEMLQEITSISYDEKSLVHIFNRHNQCSGAQSTPFKKQKLNYSLDLYGGLHLGSIKFSGPQELLFAGGNFKSFASYSFLISLGLPISKKFQRRNLLAELGMKSITIDGTDSIKGGFAADYFTNIHLKYSYAKANILYRQYFPLKPKFALFADLGFSIGIAYKIKGEVKNMTNGLVYQTYNGMNKSDATIAIGVGANLNRFLSSIRYEQGNLLAVGNTVRSNIKILYVLVGYRIF